VCGERYFVITYEYVILLRNKIKLAKFKNPLIIQL
jgi:hypothetical protein